jgi:hypothetical protein
MLIRDLRLEALTSLVAALHALSSGSQVIDVSNIVTQIESSSVSYDLSGYLGGFSEFQPSLSPYLCAG